MALISCPECEKKISDKVQSCPNCGFPFEESDIQKVEVTGVRIEKKSKNKIILGLICFLTLVIVSSSVFLFYKVQSEKKYEAELNSTTQMILENASKCEDLSNQVEETWRNAIYDTYDDYNFGYLDFDSALSNMFEDEDVKKAVEDINKTDESISLKISKLKNPPSKYKDLNEEILNFYTSYQRLKSQAVSPSGSYTSYSEDTTKKIDECSVKYTKINAKLP